VECRRTRESQSRTRTREQIDSGGPDHLSSLPRERTGSQVEGAVKEPPHYLSYLLRLWRVDGEDAEPVWRASLESARTGERMVFARLDDLFDFLREQTSEPLPHPIHQDSCSHTD
jgi:hypothetical protein